MLDYYKILGIPQTAGYPQIRTAYKKLALQYHPDRNPDNKAAEEYFKVVNEAHQLLSNPEKKAQYDLILQYYYKKYSQQYTADNSNRTTRQVYSQPRTVYDRYGKYNWQAPPQYKKAPTYRVDRNYFKIQMLTLASIALISAIIIGGFRFSEHLEARKAEELRLKNEAILTQAKDLYGNGNYKLALDMVIDLINKNPIEVKYYSEKEKMVAGLNNLTSELYRRAQYKKAIKNLEVLRDYQTPMRLATWKMIADCNYQLSEFKKAIHALEYILLRDKNNIELLMAIGDIYYTNLGNPAKAIEYYSEAKFIFKEFQSASYGEAFELIMPVDQTPETYFSLFIRRAEVNLALGNTEEAITDYNWAIYLRPQRDTTYLLRGNCLKKLNNHQKACSDWKRAFELGNPDSYSLIQTYCQ